MITTFVSRRFAFVAAFLAVVGSAVTLALVQDAEAKVSDRSCTGTLLYSEQLYAGGKVLGYVYIYDEGRTVCAVTHSGRGGYYNHRKWMSVHLNAVGRYDLSEGDSGDYERYAGHVILPDRRGGRCWSLSGYIRVYDRRGKPNDGETRTVCSH